jgi:IrrE N-terminal-like domain
MSDWIARIRSAKDVAAAANNARYIFGYSDSLVPDLAAILEIDLANVLPEYQFYVEDSVLSDDGKPVHAQTQFSPPSIIFSAESYRALIKLEPFARFTAAHELAHALLHWGDKSLNRSPNAISKLINKAMSAEWQANEFAANFLVPEHIARCYPDPYELAQLTNVSVRVAQIRLASLNLWPKKILLPKGFSF